MDSEGIQASGSNPHGVLTPSPASASQMERAAKLSCISSLALPSSVWGRGGDPGQRRGGIRGTPGLLSGSSSSAQKPVPGSQHPHPGTFGRRRTSFPLQRCHFKLSRWCLARPPSRWTSARSSMGRCFPTACADARCRGGARPSPAPVKCPEPCWHVSSGSFSPVVLVLQELEFLLDAVQGLRVSQLEGLGGAGDGTGSDSGSGGSGWCLEMGLGRGGDPRGHCCWPSEAHRHPGGFLHPGKRLRARLGEQHMEEVAEGVIAEETGYSQAPRAIVLHLPSVGPATEPEEEDEQPRAAQSMQPTWAEGATPQPSRPAPAAGGVVGGSVLARVPRSRASQPLIPRLHPDCDPASESPWFRGSASVWEEPQRCS